MTPAEYQKIKDKAAKLRQEMDRAQGSLDRVKTQIENEFGVKSLEEAREKLTELETEKDKLEVEFSSAAGEFEKKWGDKLS